MGEGFAHSEGAQRARRTFFGRFVNEEDSELRGGIESFADESRIRRVGGANKPYFELGESCSRIGISCIFQS